MMRCILKFNSVYIFTAAPSAEDIVMYFEKNNGMVQDYLENNELVSAVLYRIHLKTQKHPLKQARISFVTSPTIHSLPEGGISVQFDSKYNILKCMTCITFLILNKEMGKLYHK